MLRENGKNSSGMRQRQSLSKAQRREVHSKTDGRCHICGCDVPVDNFEADHVKNHTSGGECLVENFLPSCRTCNNYRWHYLPQELQWILKIGVWAKTHMSKKTSIGEDMLSEFVRHDVTREGRRKAPRTPYTTSEESG